MHDQRHSCLYCPQRSEGLCSTVGNGDSTGFRALENAPKQQQVFSAGQSIYGEGSPAKDFYIVKTGWVALSQNLASGGRQIIRFVLPGEIFGLEPGGQSSHFHAAEAITVASCCIQASEQMAEFRLLYPNYSERYIWMLERERLQYQNQLTNLGRRDAVERVVQLLVELVMRSTGRYPLEEGVTYRVPLTQRMVADAVGLTTIHVNRTLRRLQSRGVLEFRDGLFWTDDLAGLMAIVTIGPNASALWAPPLHAPSTPLAGQLA